MSTPSRVRGRAAEEAADRGGLILRFGRIAVHVHGALNLVVAGPACEYLSLILQIVIGVRAAPR
jgi:hypothetical protein